MGRHELQIFEVATPKPCVWPDLRTVTPQELELDALLFAPPREIRQVYQGKTLRISGPTWGRAQGKRLAAKVMFGDVAYFALFPANLPQHILSMNGYCGVIETWHPDTQALVLDLLLGDVLAPLQTHLGGEVKISGLSDAPIAFENNMLSFDVSVPGEQDFVFYIAAKSAQLRDIAKIGGTGPAHAQSVVCTKLPFSARFCLPSATAASNEVAALRPGDGLVIDAEWSGRKNVLLSVQGHLCANVTHRDGLMVLASPLRHEPSMNQQEGIEMNQQSNIIHPHPEHVTDDLPVTITVELGRTTLTLEQIKELTVGGVLPFADELTTRVKIFANGATLGHGDLVRFDDKIAVRLTELD